MDILPLHLQSHIFSIVQDIAPEKVRQLSKAHKSIYNIQNILLNRFLEENSKITRKLYETYPHDTDTINDFTNTVLNNILEPSKKLEGEYKVFFNDLMEWLRNNAILTLNVELLSYLICADIPIYKFDMPDMTKEKLIYDMWDFFFNEDKTDTKYIRLAQIWSMYICRNDLEYIAVDTLLNDFLTKSNLDCAVTALNTITKFSKENLCFKFQTVQYQFMLQTLIYFITFDYVFKNHITCKNCLSKIATIIGLIAVNHNSIIKEVVANQIAELWRIYSRHPTYVYFSKLHEMLSM